MDTATCTISFVCLHGSAKSLIAAEYLNRSASRSGSPLRANSAGLEPDADVPAHVVAGLREHGIDVLSRKPAAATREHLSGAHCVIAFGCDVSPVAPAGTRIVQWADCPAVSDGFGPAWDYITRHVDDLLRNEAA